MKILRIDSVDSTNSYVKREAASLQAPVMVVAREQTAGRGQRGNTWESIPGKNLTFSIFLRPENFPAREQFHLSEAFALGVRDALRTQCGVETMVKWPNDIYAGDRKICGILIEHSIGPRNIIHSIAGAGININQERFFSDAPNPVSVRQLKGKCHDLGTLAERFGDIIMQRLEGISSQQTRDEVHEEFKRSLWRGDGNFYPFRDKATDGKFYGRIVDVAPSGHLCIVAKDASELLRNSPAYRSDGRLEYAFKEVEFLLE